MKAMILTAYGSPDMLQLRDVEKPSPQEDEVLVRIRATPVSFGDRLARKFNQISPGAFSMPALLWLPTKFFFGFRTPKIKILGSEFAGEVESVGKAVTTFKAGDQVFGYRGPNMGANTEYLCVKENSLLTRKPANMSYEEASTVPYGALTALSLLRKVNVQAGQKVLIHGASGAIGSYAVQFAKLFGAEVTGVCGTPRVDYVKSIGADHVIDYTREDFTRNGKTYDLIFDVVGKCSFDRCKQSLTPNGRLLYVSFKMKQVRQMLWTSFFGSKKVICALSSETRDDLVYIRDLIEAGKLTSVVDRCYPLEQTAEAHRYIETGHKQGHVVITIA